MQRLVFDVDGMSFPSIEQQTAAKPSIKRKPKKSKSRAVYPASRRPFSDGIVGAFVTT